MKSDDVVVGFPRQQNQVERRVTMVWKLSSTLSISLSFKFNSSTRHIPSPFILRTLSTCLFPVKQRDKKGARSRDAGRKVSTDHQQGARGDSEPPETVPFRETSTHSSLVPRTVRRPFSFQGHLLRNSHCPIRPSGPQ